MAGLKSENNVYSSPGPLSSGFAAPNAIMTKNSKSSNKNVIFIVGVLRVEKERERRGQGKGHVISGMAIPAIRLSPPIINMYNMTTIIGSHNTGIAD